MPQFRIPVATYRVQFNQNFRFVDASDLVPYLSDLGITDLYASPQFKPRRGSSHGYDITNPLRINSELGTEQEFDEMRVKLKHYGMGVLQDIVPNHMAATSENPWWRDVLESGPASRFAEYFDINWRPATSKAAFLQENRVLLPVLGDLYGNVLANGEFALKLDDNGLFVRYYEHAFPLDPASYREILVHSLAQLPDSPELNALLAEIERLPHRNSTDPEQLALRRRNKETVKERLWNLYHTVADIKRAIDETLRILTGNKDHPLSFDALDRILAGQAYRLAYWKIAYEEINYRRFFDQNDLVGLRVEVPEVFAARHARTLDLVRAGKTTGLRIDHIDGLHDPLGYLHQLQNTIGADAGAQPGQSFYIVVEKILGTKESLPAEWPVSGTTGYEFQNALNGIFIHPRGWQALEEIYSARTGSTLPFAEICYACNKQVMQQLFAGEVNALGRELGRLAAQDRQARDLPLSELMEVLVEVTACLPIYRTYIRDFEIPERDRQYIQRTLDLARSRTPEDRISSAAFEFMRRVLLLDPPYYAQDHKADWLGFVMLWQQFTGPVMAKGLEDTAFYAHNSLISRNEVGGDPLREDPPMDVEAFHRFNQERLKQWPHSLNASSTHDSKRSEDIRARVNVLSELPERWATCLDTWIQVNQSHKITTRNGLVPDPHQEILLYQTLLGAWPTDSSDLPDFPERMKEFMVKAAREAKVHTSWLTSDTEHEDALRNFVDQVLSPSHEGFLSNFRDFQKEIAFHGTFNALAQVLLKITSPGVPDFYQGTELWNLSLVDPDNRRPINYALRTSLLETLKRREAEDRAALLDELVERWEQPGIKLYLTYKALEFRRLNQDLFQQGDYLPLPAEGCSKEHVCAFARRRGDRWAVTAVPRLTTGLQCRPPDLRSPDWRDTVLLLPDAAPSRWRNILTGAVIQAAPEVPLQSLLGAFPVSLLEAVL